MIPKENDRRNKIAIYEQSLFSVRIVILIILVLTTVAFYYEKSALGFVLFLCFLMGIVSRVWTRLSSKGLRASVTSDRHTFFPGDSCKVKFTVENDKPIGTPWVEFSLEMEKPIVMRPERGILINTDTGYDTCQFIVKTGKIRANDTAIYETIWHARKRGTRTFRTMDVRTGDGFSLCSSRLSLENSSSRELVVYPKMIPVNIKLFTAFQWEGDHHEKGVLEDPTVIKLTRPYEEGDSMKHINWRIAARGQGLAVNQFEHIRPNKCHIIFDGQSFDGPKRHRKELEDCLSILASLSLALEEWGMNTGYSFPKNLNGKQTTIPAEKDNISEVLYGMAAYEFLRPTIVGSDENGKTIYKYEESLFDDEIVTATFNETGRIYFVTYDDMSASNSSFLKEFNENNITVLTYAFLTQLKM